ncbi:hypothetical protein WN944_005500 [Citrus x changshan-huyou]|uniref:Uncharacterized protein n=1 Tax=Citrus x changshan-huyou TaxID=2935761 RepID=A0AAP0M2I7_9ROSI
MTIGGLSKLSGSVPSEIGNCSGLLNVTLSNNSLDGTIPLEMGKIIFLEYLDLSYNNIPGTVPEFINRIMPADLVHNNLEEETPTTFGYSSPAPAPVTVQAHGTLFLLRRKNKRAELTSGEIKSQDKDAFSIWNCDGRIAFEEIIRATEDFDIKYCIGTGCYGSVYKARLPSGRIWFRTGEICFLQKFPE